MKTLGNILWFLFGGLLGGLAWCLAGCIFCITIIGIPIGVQCFKFAEFAFWPFGREIVYDGRTFSFLVDIIWVCFFGLEMAIANLPVWLPSVHHDSGNSVRNAVFQNGQAVIYAVWGKNRRERVICFADEHCMP